MERTADGKWQYVQRVIKKEFNGTESWSTTSIKNGNGTILGYRMQVAPCLPKIDNDNASSKPNMACASYTPVSNDVYSSIQSDATIDTLSDRTITFYGNRLCILNKRYATASSVTDFVSYLAAQAAAGTPVTIYYALATPIVTDITDLMSADALNFEVEPGGSITMHNAAELSVPATIQYVEKLSEVVSND